MNEKSETKLCKYCQTEIPAKAKICPNCKKKQGGATKWFVAVVIVIILLNWKRSIYFLMTNTATCGRIILLQVAGG